MMRPSRDLPEVYLCVAPVDFRKSITGLSLLVEVGLGLDPFAPTLYVFINRRRDKLKMLYWDKNGFCLWYKRLEQQRFKWPRDLKRTIVTLNGEQLNWLLDGEQLNWLLDGFDVWRDTPHKKLYFDSVM